MKSTVRIKNNSFVSVVTSTLLLMISASFNTVQNQQEQFKGRWEALWQIKNTTRSNDIMQGYMDFKANGQMEITAYGYPGCLFSNDTIYNELRWQVLGDSLILYSNQDRFNLTYIVQKVSPNEVLLQLMDDIYITLKR